jgi:UDP-glucose:(heptosyl)LPS alpha-1,3-glucosyltransferase
MNIALIRARYDPFGGAERFVETAVEALAGEGAALTIITREWPARANAAIAHRIVNPPYWTSTGRDRGFARAVRELLGREKFDLVQSHERIVGCDIYRAGDGVHASWLAQRARISGAIRRKTTEWNPHHRYLLATERAMFTSPALKAVICNSRMVKDEIVQYFGTDPEKLHVIYSGVDSTRFTPDTRTTIRDSMRAQLSIDRAAKVALFVGSGFERKGLAAFLHAVAGVPDLHAVVVGKDKHLARYRALAHAQGIAGRTFFAGGVADVRPYYAIADVFALPTLYDPFPNACLEAMAAGLPVITSRTSGAAEFITDGKEGFVADALDVPTLREALALSLTRPEMGVAARRRVLACTPQTMAAQYLALYRELIAARRTVPA